MRSRVEADSAFLFNQARLVELFGVRAVLLGPGNQELATLSAETGTLRLTFPLLVVRGSVSVASTDGARRIETDELELDLDANTVNAPGATVRVEGGSSRELPSFRGSLGLRPLPPP